MAGAALSETHRLSDPGAFQTGTDNLFWKETNG